MPTDVTKIMEYVANFLNENNCSELTELWMEKQPDIEKMSKTKKTTGKTSGKDPNKPKRGRSAYIYFCTENRAEIKENMDGEPTPAEVMREMGRCWREIKDSTEEEDVEKHQKYTEMASKDKERYLNEMESYVPLDENEVEALNNNKKKKSSKKKNDDKPKKARSAYIFFCVEKRAEIKEENPDATPQDITKIIGELWNEYKNEAEYASELEKFNEMNRQDKLRYEKELAEHEPTPQTEEKQTKKKPVKREIKIVTREISDDEETQVINTDNEDTELEEDTYDEISEPEIKQIKKPKRKAQSETKPEPKQCRKAQSKPETVTKKKPQPYLNFCKENRQIVIQNNPSFSLTDVTKALAIQWKALSAEERAEWA